MMSQMLQFEADYAKENNAKFWRSGSPFGVKKKPNVNRKDIQLIGEYFPNGGETYSCDELLRKLENDLGYDNTRAKKLITECQENGFLTYVENSVYTRQLEKNTSLFVSYQVLISSQSISDCLLFIFKNRTAIFLPRQSAGLEKP